VRTQNITRINDPARKMVHVRFMGQSRDIALEDLGLSGEFADPEVFTALARFLEINVRQLDGYVVQRHPNGNVTVRPEAVFGKK
jgi:hypothetical protein